MIHASHLFDGHASSIRHNVDITIEGNRIRSVEPHRSELHSGEVIDATGLTVMPGLIEMHSHLKKW